jgi:hypothetical protein
MNIAASSTFVAADGEAYELQIGRWSRRVVRVLFDQGTPRLCATRWLGTL